MAAEKNPPINEVIEANVIGRFVQFLTRFDHTKLQFEAAWALTNVASGTSEHTRVVIDSGAVPIFVQLMQSPEAEVREQAVWALGNIAGDSPHCRDLVLEKGALPPLLALVNDSCPTTLLRNCTWTLSNFCRGKPQPRFDQVAPALPVFAALLRSDDVEVLTDTCWALSYLSDGTNDKIQAVIDAGISRRLVELLLHPNATVLVPALRRASGRGGGGNRRCPRSPTLHCWRWQLLTPAAAAGCLAHVGGERGACRLASAWLPPPPPRGPLCLCRKGRVDLGEAARVFSK